MPDKDNTILKYRIFYACGLVLCLVFLIYDIYGALQGDKGRLLGAAAMSFCIASIIIMLVKTNKSTES